MKYKSLEISYLADRMEFVDELATLHQAQWGHLNPEMTLHGRKELIAGAAGKKAIPSVFIALVENELAGFAAIIPHDMEDRPDLTPWLAAVYVKEEFRRQGIASKLVTRCEQEAAELNVSTLYLYTNSASGLYEKLGWSLLEQYEHKDTVVDIMCKRIQLFGNE